MDVKQRSLLAASVAGLVAVTGLVSSGRSAHAAEGEKVPCYGINKCKETGDCSGAGHGCAGHNTCAETGFITLEKETCLKIQGGRLTAEK